MSDDKKRDRALQRRVRERQNKTGESYQAAWRSLTGEDTASSARISERATSLPVWPAQSFKLAWKIQAPALYVDRITIANAEDWIINDIQVQGKSIFVQHGDLPAIMFRGDADVILAPLKKGDHFFIEATYFGKEPSGVLEIELSGTASSPTTPKALSYFLPLSTHAPLSLSPEHQMQIIGRPQTAFLASRIVIANTADWVISDIRIGCVSQFIQLSDLLTGKSGLPAEIFNSGTINDRLKFIPVQPGQDFVLIAWHKSNHGTSAPFFCGAQGQLADNVNTTSSVPVSKALKENDNLLALHLTSTGNKIDSAVAPVPRVLPNRKTRISAQAGIAFIIEKLSISNAGTPGGAADWVVNGIEINGQPLHIPKDLSGELFGLTSVNVHFTGLKAVEKGHEVAVYVTYIGPNSEGAHFFAAAIGSHAPQNPTVIPIFLRNTLPQPLQCIGPDLPDLDTLVSQNSLDDNLLRPESKMTICISALSSPFQVQRLVIENGSTDCGAADWIVHDLRIDGRSQLPTAPDTIPGDMFAENVLENFVKFDSSPVVDSVEIDVTYVGLPKEDLRFYARLEGTVVRDDYDRPPPDLTAWVETVGGDDRARVRATCNFRPPAPSSGM